MVLKCIANLVSLRVKPVMMAFLVHPVAQALMGHYANMIVAHVLVSSVIGIQVDAALSAELISILTQLKETANNALMAVLDVPHIRLVTTVF